MKSYFDSQMRVLEEDVTIFAKQYPEHARHLNLDSLDDRDPTVERLLEGFAYLTGRIEQQLDNGLMGLSETLLENISPTSLQSTPSKAIAQFSFLPGSIEKNKVLLTTKEKLQSPSVGKERTRCQFSVENNQCVYPVRLTCMQQQQVKHGGYELRLSFVVESETASFSINSLPLYFNGELEQRLSWLYALLEHSEAITMEYNKQTYFIQAQHPVFNEASLKSFDPFGIELLKDFFSFRDKFMFVELTKFPNVEFSSNDQFDVVFRLNAPIKDEYLRKENALLLGCVAITNVFDHAAEPSVYDVDRHSSPLILEATQRKSMCLQSITEISSSYAIENNLSYESFCSYQKHKKNCIYYRVVRQRSLTQAHHLVLSGAHTKEKQRLTILVKACNGTYPRKYLSVRSLSFSSRTKSSMLTGTNITRPTEYLPALENQQYYWRLLGMLSETYKNLSDRSQLLELLHAHDYHDHYQGKIDALLETKIQRSQQFQKGVLYLGVSYSITLDDTAFLNEKEVYLFGSMLHFFLLHHVEINHFLMTKIHCVHSEKQFKWQSTNGKVSKW